MLFMSATLNVNILCVHPSELAARSSDAYAQSYLSCVFSLLEQVISSFLEFAFM